MLLMDNSIYKFSDRGLWSALLSLSPGTALVLMVVLATLGLAGCSTNTTDDAIYDGADPIVIRVTGFGTYADAKDKGSERKRLMAMRASKLDAYRSLAERVYGTVLFGSSTVNDFVLENDQFRAVVDSYIRGAKVITMNELSGGSFETVLELVLEPQFRHCLTYSNHYKASGNCSLPIPLGNDRSGDMNASNAKTDDLYFIK